MFALAGAVVIGAIIAIVVVASGGGDKKAGSGSGSQSTTAANGSAGSATGSAASTTAGSAAVATGSAAGSGAGSAAGYKVGDPVYAMWEGNNEWYPGRIGKINDDGTYRVNYSDGDVSPKVPAKRMKPRKAGAGGGGGGGGGTTSSADAPCPGPGITRRCGGRCVNIQEDSNNCGGCGVVCRDGFHCDGHLFCRDADGNLQ